MKDYLKYITVNGKLKSRGEFAENSAGYRNYNSVIITDENGEQTHFHSLGVSKQMDDRLNFKQTMTFYILRAHVNQTLTGILYALDLKKEKIYHPETAIPALETFAAVLQKRYHYSTNPMLFTGATFTAGMVIGYGLSMALNEPG